MSLRRKISENFISCELTVEMFIIKWMSQFGPYSELKHLKNLVRFFQAKRSCWLEFLEFGLALDPTQVESRP